MLELFPLIRCLMWPLHSYLQVLDILDEVEAPSGQIHTGQIGTTQIPPPMPHNFSSAAANSNPDKRPEKGGKADS
jgi:hypothetical protein